MQKATVSSTQTRASDEATIKRLLSTPIGKTALERTHSDATQVNTAISTLSNQDLARIAARADKAQRDFAAGAITNHLLLLIVIGIIIAVIVIVAVKV